MSEDTVHNITSLGADWLPGDIVYDAEGNIRIRTDHPVYVWGYPNEGNTRDVFGHPILPDGGVEEHEAVRPITLLVRDGQPVLGREITESR